MEVLEPTASMYPYRDERELTAIDFFPRCGSLLTINIGEVEWREERFLDLFLLQPIDVSNAIVRPIGGTPKPSILALSSRRLSLEFVSCPQVIRLRIVAALVPIIRNLAPFDPVGENRLRNEVTGG